MPHHTDTDSALLEQWRDDTPGVSRCIHLNNAGAALMPRSVTEAVREHLDLEEMIGGYEAAREAEARIEQAYRSVARLTGASRREIAFVENTTVAISQALSALEFRKGDTVLTTQADYSSNQIMLLNLARRWGIRPMRAAELPEGGVDPDSVRELMKKERPAAMVMSWVPTHSGLVQDAFSTGAICREFGVPFLLDACQAVGQLPIDVGRLPCDFLAASSRKFLRGPRGTGFLYINSEMLDRGIAPLFPDTRGAEWITADRFELHPDAARFENWEYAYALILGMGAAADYALQVGMETIHRRSKRLAERLRMLLGRLDGARIMDYGENLCAIVTVLFEGTETTQLVDGLSRENVHTSASLRRHAVIDMGKNRVNAVLRLSPHYYNSDEELDRTVALLEELLRKFRK